MTIPFEHLETGFGTIRQAFAVGERASAPLARPLAALGLVAVALGTIAVSPVQAQPPFPPLFPQNPSGISHSPRTAQEFYQDHGLRFGDCLLTSVSARPTEVGGITVVLVGGKLLQNTRRHNETFYDPDRFQIMNGEDLTALNFYTLNCDTVFVANQEVAQITGVPMELPQNQSFFSSLTAENAGISTPYACSSVSTTTNVISGNGQIYNNVSVFVMESESYITFLGSHKSGVPTFPVVADFDNDGNLEPYQASPFPTGSRIPSATNPNGVENLFMAKCAYIP